jgi:hypothetical protein
MARDIGDLIVRMKVILALYIVYLDDVRSERLRVGVQICAKTMNGV